MRTIDKDAGWAGMWAQFGAACVFGFIAFWLAADTTPRAQMLISLVAGFSGAWLLTKVYVWVRFGPNAAKTMSLDP